MLAVAEPTAPMTRRFHTKASPVPNAPSASIEPTTAGVTGPCGVTPVASTRGSSSSAPEPICAVVTASGPSGTPTMCRRAYGKARP